ncbi:alpha/beta hydrolase [Microvirga sesbaniae]|uniref:alpha/beta hydrolase n=1 Tax=Microvirga sesbaniae TaxID=681392 RepID=UPI0021C792A7|nr:alpha/beta fold hydrolase [Microvirga sp. HBU67692]
MLFPVSRLALVCLAGLALSGCLGEDSALTSPVSSQVGLARDPKLLVATTRLPVGDPPKKPWFSSERSADLVFAEARLAPPADSLLGHSGWSIAKVENVDHSKAAQAFAQAAFGHNLLLYIHGYRESFETAATSTVDLSEGIRFAGVTGLFTWPSAASTFSYVADRESAMWSRDALEDLLTAIAKTPSGGRIHIVAHSMGTLLTLETLRMLRASGGENAMDRIGAVVLAAPDIDIDLFARGLERLGPDAKKITVISSTNDRALAVSSRLAGGIIRAGAADRERLESLGVRVADASEFGGGIINHDLFLTNKDVQQVIKRAIERS